MILYLEKIKGYIVILVLWNSGILPSLVGISHVAIQFPAYEKIKGYMAMRGNIIALTCFLDLCLKALPFPI